MATYKVLQYPTSLKFRGTSIEAEDKFTNLVVDTRVNLS